jgi:hypothetical protein
MGVATLVQWKWAKSGGGAKVTSLHLYIVASYNLIGQSSQR